MQTVRLVLSSFPLNIPFVEELGVEIHISNLRLVLLPSFLASVPSFCFFSQQNRRASTNANRKTTAGLMGEGTSI